MGRPVKIFRVYYADSMGEPDLPLAMWPRPPMAWAFFAPLCSALLCFECVGRHGGLSGPRGAAARTLEWLLRSWGWGLLRTLGPSGMRFSARPAVVLQGASVSGGFCCLGRECPCWGPCLDRVSVLLCLRILSLCVVLVSPVPLLRTQGQRALGCRAGPLET